MTCSTWDPTLHALSTSDLLEVLECGAGKLLETFGGLEPLSRIPHRELARLTGLKLSAALRIAASFELARRRAFEGQDPRPRLSSSHDAATFFRPRLADRPQEVLAVAHLDTHHHLLGYEEVTRGTLTESLVHPREIYAGAVALRAASILLAHNHPSGVATPSLEDRETTHRVARAGRLLGIELLDHVVLGQHTHHSFADEGRLHP